jgi:glycerol-3-phosphate dehydrogenase
MPLRDTNLRRLGDRLLDVLILGGGINGAVGAAALSARGLKVGLIDRGDFGGVTSQSSSNLAWGGIKYLESYELGLVRKLCRVRNELLRAYPSTVEEIRFLVAHEKGFRHPLWKLAAGSWLYWLIGSCFTQRPRWLSKAQLEREEPVLETAGTDGGFEYSDAFLHDNDARFVWQFVRSALDHGCAAANYVESLGAKWEGDLWRVQARDLVSGRELPLRARVLVNACGPYADEHNGRAGVQTRHRHVFSKGIHILVRRLTPHRRVLTFFADDGRLFFVIPMGPRTCIGTTDTKVESPEVSVTPEDRAFVLGNINKRLRLEQPLTLADIVAERCGVRPLVVDASAAAPGHGGGWMQLSRKHVLEADRLGRHVTIFGGKLTDCLNVGEELCDEVSAMGLKPPYPGRRWFGEPSREQSEAWFHQARLMDLDGYTAPQAAEKLSTRLWRRYGAEAFSLLEAIRQEPRSAELLIENAEYLRCEIEQAARREMIVTLDDFLRRRSKIALVVHREVLRKAAGLREACGILFGEQAEERLREYFGEAPPHAAPEVEQNPT